MTTTAILFLGIGLLFALLTESNGLGNGCEWSGCREFQLLPMKCTTGVIGGMGRHNRFNSKYCGWSGRKEFCCDDDCGYLACGVNAPSDLTRYTDDAEERQCGFEGIKREFVCGTNGYDIPVGISTNKNRVGRTGSSNGGFRSPDGQTTRPVSNYESTGFRSA